MSRRTRKQQQRAAAQQDTIQANRSVISQRMSLNTSAVQGKGFGGHRNYYQVLGYPLEIEIEQYRAKYDRQGLAGRIVDFPADETWRDEPEMLEGNQKESSDAGPFVQEFRQMASRLRLYHYCQRVDKLTGLGHFGILLLGLAGNDDLSQPVTKLYSVDDVIYLRPYSEESVEIEQVVTDPGDSRYGMPLIYKITPSTINTIQLTPLRVHWTRVLHVTEGLLDNEVYGRPRLMRVYNDLDDILKIVGGSAEATWKLMRKGFVLNIDSDASLAPADEAALQEQVDELDHGLRRFLQTRGMSVQDLGSEVVDPSGIFGIIIDMIAAATGIPQRILLGSERGELASSQDASNWAGRIADRRTNWAEPVILRPLIQRLIDWGALTAPRRNEYFFRWQPLFEMSELEKATLAQTWANANQAMGGQAISAEEWRGEYTPFGRELPPELVKRIKEAAAAQQPDRVEKMAEVVRNSTAFDKHSMMQLAARLMEIAQ